jgi:hypothetical protein
MRRTSDPKEQRKNVGSQIENLQKVISLLGVVRIVSIVKAQRNCSSMLLVGTAKQITSAK